MSIRLLAASAAPILNLREGLFAKRETVNLTTAEQRKWIKRKGAVTVALASGRMKDYFVVAA